MHSRGPLPEIASYDLTYPRYGEPRPGLAVTIFVTEPFSAEARVKADQRGNQLVLRGHRVDRVDALDVQVGVVGQLVGQCRAGPEGPRGVVDRGHDDSHDL